MPEHATKVFSGVLFDVYQWQQQMYDGSTKTFEKLKRQDAVVVLGVTTEQKILVTMQEQPGKGPYAGLPGGHIDSNEPPHDAAIRELREETGYEADRWELYSALQPTSKVDWALYYFIAKGCRPVTDVALDGGEKISVQQLDFEQFVDFCSRPDFVETELKLAVLEAKSDPAKLSALKTQLLSP